MHSTERIPSSSSPRESGQSATARGWQFVAMAATVFATIGIALAYASAFAPPPLATLGVYVMAASMPLALMAVMLLGASRRDRAPGVMGWAMLLVFGLVTGGFLLALWLPAEAPGDPLWLGLPLRAAIVLYGVGVLPLLVLPVAYALTFERLTLSDDDLARVRAARRGGDDAP